MARLAHVCLCLSLAVGMLSCAEGAALTVEKKAVPARKFEVKRGPLESTLLLYGRLEAVKADVLVGPKTEMWSLSIRRLAEDGSNVQEGDVVVEFDNSAFASRLSQHSLALNTAETELVRQEAATEASLADKQIALVRAEIAQKKAELQAAVPADTFPLRVYQEKQLALERARSDFAKAEEDQASAIKSAALDLKVRRIAIEKAQRELEETQRGLSAMSLKAPRNGLIVVSENRRERRPYRAGDTVWPGQTVATLPDLHAYKFVAQLSDVDDGQVQVGMQARCFADAYPDRALLGEVHSLSPVAQSPSRDSSRSYFIATIRLPSTSDQLLRPGMSARAEIVRRQVKEATLVPRATLRSDATGFAVTSLSGEILKVDLDFCAAESCAVLSKLAPGTKLIEAL